jgi:transcriptional regulator with XRE-family HTH domain
MLSNLKTALAARRMRQVELAQAIGVAPSTLSEFIHGRAVLPPHLLTRISEALQADPAWLFARVTYIPALQPNKSNEESAASAAA